MQTFTIRQTRKAAHNSTYPKGGVSCSKDSFVVNGSLVFQIKFSGKNPALRVAAKRCATLKTKMENSKLKSYKMLKTKIIIFISLISYANGFSQEAENIFHKEYSKLSFVFQPSILKKSDAWNRDGSTYPNMKFTNDFSYQFGVYYNFAQSGNFNFKTGIIAKEFIPKFDLNISDSDIGNGQENLLTQFDPYNQFIISIPIKTEYYLKLNKKINLSIGAGLNLNLITGMNETLITRISVGDSNGNYKDIFSAKSDGQNSINFSAEFSFGTQYKTKFALFDLSFFINNSIAPDYVSGQYEIYNLNNSPDKVGDFIIRNNFYGLSLSVSPKKGWLKKKV